MTVSGRGRLLPRGKRDAIIHPMDFFSIRRSMLPLLMWVLSACFLAGCAKTTIRKVLGPSDGGALDTGEAPGKDLPDATGEGAGLFDLATPEAIGEIFADDAGAEGQSDSESVQICDSCSAACPCPEGTLCLDGECCQPDCGAVECGDDGCEGSCGTCFSVEKCVEGECVMQCTDECDGEGEKSCQQDFTTVCGNFDLDPCLEWGTEKPCLAGSVCEEGECICVPECAAKECGPDGCGAACGDCLPGWDCDNGLCVEQCADECLLEGEKSCAGNSLISCGEFDEDDCLDWGEQEPCPEGHLCKNGVCVCWPNCAGKECGPDGCGGTCGSCSTCFSCHQGLCLPGGFVKVGTTCPEGYFDVGRWRTGPGQVDGVDEGCGFEQECIDTGWMVFCVDNPEVAFVNVAFDDCGDPHPYLECPDGYKKVGTWHVGLQPACGLVSGYGHENGTIRGGWMAGCVIDAGYGCGGAYATGEDCGQDDPSCPQGWSEVGTWHTAPGDCDGQDEGEGLNQSIDSGWMTMCVGPL